MQSIIKAGGSMSPAPKTIVTVGEVAVELKMSFYAQMHMDELGVDTGKLFVILNTRPGNLVAYMKVFAALAAFSYVEKGLTVPTPHEWQAEIEGTENPLETWKAMVEAVREVVGLAKKTSAVLADATSENLPKDPQVQ